MVFFKTAWRRREEECGWGGGGGKAPGKIPNRGVAVCGNALSLRRCWERGWKNREREWEGECTSDRWDGGLGMQKVLGKRDPCGGGGSVDIDDLHSFGWWIGRGSAVWWLCLWLWDGRSSSDWLEPAWWIGVGAVKCWCPRLKLLHLILNWHISLQHAWSSARNLCLERRS